LAGCLYMNKAPRAVDRPSRLLDEQFGLFRPYALPLPNQILPLDLLTDSDRELVNDPAFMRATGLLLMSAPNAFMYSMWFSISAKFKDRGYSASVEIQFQAVEQDDGTPGVNEPQRTNVFGTPLQGPGGGYADEFGPAARGRGRGRPQYDDWDTFFAPWLGCRCSWPVSQLCWHLCYGAQVAQWFAVSFTFLTVVFQISILDAMVEANFLAAVPRTTTWDEWAQSQTPWIPRLVWMLGKIFIFFYVVGLNNLRQSRSFLASSDIRLLLASMANRYEGQTYAYFTVFVWTVITELETVILNAYFPLISAVIINSESSGVAINDASVILLVFSFIPNLQEWAMGFIAFATCLTQPMFDSSMMYVVGARVATLERVFSYLVFWWTAICTVAMLVLIHFSFNVFYLWVIPISAIYFMTVWQAVPYCLEGWPQCFPHSGACVTMTAISTTLVWVTLFILRYGCFLFPCVCAPEVPGWMFFPPSAHLRSPLEGIWDVHLPLLFLDRVLGWSGAAEWDCAWEPLPSDYEPFHTSVGLLTEGEMAQVRQQEMVDEMTELREDVHSLERMLALLLAS